MSIGQLVTASIFTGLAFVIAWAVLWSVTVPALFEGRTWAGHDEFFILVFIMGMIVGPLAVAPNGSKGH